MRLFLFFHNYGSYVKAFIFLCIVGCTNFTGWAQTAVALLGVVLMLALSTLQSFSLIQIDKLPNVTLLGASRKRYRRNLIWTSLAIAFVMLFFYVRSDLFDFLTTIGFGAWPLLSVMLIYLIESLLPLSRWSCVVVGSAMLTKEKKEFRLLPQMTVASLNRDAALVSGGEKEFRLWITEEDVETLKALLKQLPIEKQTQ